LRFTTISVPQCKGYACAPGIALKAFGNATLPRIGGIFRQ
jgi:hypothetical protein